MISTIVKMKTYSGSPDYKLRVCTVTQILDIQKGPVNIVQDYAVYDNGNTYMIRERRFEDSDMAERRFNKWAEQLTVNFRKGGEACEY